MTKCSNSRGTIKKSSCCQTHTSKQNFVKRYKIIPICVKIKLSQEALISKIEISLHSWTDKSQSNTTSRIVIIFNALEDVPWDWNRHYANKILSEQNPIWNALSVQFTKVNFWYRDVNVLRQVNSGAIQESLADLLYHWSDLHSDLRFCFSSIVRPSR